MLRNPVFVTWNAWYHQLICNSCQNTQSTGTCFCLSFLCVTSYHKELKCKFSLKATCTCSSCINRYHNHSKFMHAPYGLLNVNGLYWSVKSKAVIWQFIEDAVWHYTLHTLSRFLDWNILNACTMKWGFQCLWFLVVCTCMSYQQPFILYMCMYMYVYVYCVCIWRWMTS